MGTRTGPAVRRRAALAGAALALGASAGAARAQAIERALPSTAPPAAPLFADGDDALPGTGRVAAAGPLARGLVIGAAGGYGVRGATLDADDRHHRTTIAIAASARPTAWLALAGSFSERYDAHRGGVRDAGWIGDPRLAARATRALGGAWVGAQFGVWLPGADAPSIVPAAITPEVLLLAAVAPSAAWALAGQAGVRLDRSAEAIDDAGILSPPDRLSLGLGRGAVALFGLTARVRGDGGELFGEASWEPRFGDDASPRSAWPLRAGLGVRRGFGGGLLLGARVEAVLADAPSTLPTAPLAPVEPAASFVVSISWRGLGGAAAAGLHPAPALARTARPAPRPATLIVVVESNGGPVADAEVAVAVDGRAATIARTDAAGRATIALPAGTAEVSVSGAGFHLARSTARLVAGGSRTALVALERELPPGQLRGGVRSRRGKPLAAARLRIEPGGHEVACDKRGEFLIDLPPGSYAVEISGPGHAAQRRQVQIDQDGVTILNVDLGR